MIGADLAKSSQQLVGTRFRLHGRDPASGLDCIGLLAAALHLAGRPVTLPSGYPLRLRDVQAWLPDPANLGFDEASGVPLPGDVVLLGLGAAQFHLAIAAEDGGWIHAHAGLRRVIHSSVLPTGEIAHHWRLAPAI